MKPKISKGATKLYFMDYPRVVIISFKRVYICLHFIPILLNLGQLYFETLILVILLYRWCPEICPQEKAPRKATTGKRPLGHPPPSLPKKLGVENSNFFSNI